MWIVVDKLQITYPHPCAGNDDLSERGHVKTIFYCHCLIFFEPTKLVYNGQKCKKRMVFLAFLIEFIPSLPSRQCSSSQRRSSRPPLRQAFRRVRSAPGNPSVLSVSSLCLPNC